MRDDGAGRDLRTVAAIVVVELFVAALAHRFDPLLRLHAWLTLGPPLAGQASRTRHGAAPVVAGLVGAALAGALLVLLGDRTWAYATWLAPATAAAAAVGGLVARRLHGEGEPRRLESAGDPPLAQTLPEE